MTLSQTMACRNVMTILSTMQKQNLHTVENQSHPKKTIPTYKPNIWKYDHLLSLKSEYSKKKYKVEAEKLINEVSCTFSNTVSLALLELVDRIDKFGLSSYFEVETKEALEKIIKCMNSGASYSSSKDEDLYAIALCFRLLREHGYHASQDMLKGLFAGKGKLMTKKVSDIKTLLELLEGSYLSMDDENLQNDIRIFSTKNLKNLSTSNVDRFSTNGEYLSNSLKYNPLAFRVRWYDVRRHLNAQEELECYTNPMLLKLAKLNFNIIQATHQKDLKHVIRWWRNLCIVEDLSFTRDRIVESFFYAVGVTSEPQHGSWVNFCKALLVEATWYHKGHIPTLEEYLDNGWISSSGPLLSCHVIFGLTNEITNETLDLCKNCKEIIYHTSVIIRLCNDKGTSTAELERGDVASSILCYMQEENVSEEVAREHIESIILDSWKKINYHFNTLSTSHRKLVKHVINEARMAHVMYQFGDGFGVQDGETRDHILFNLVEPLT
ncbi:(E,E)-alpha-farnesene synthase-like isoform X2 [Lycium ferocissimum]|uniref:(E,E)-alpha-farnesene synthase-like isoform X2 n=1 Tax=Lycium ferocissimum TaxID=112874 RepID=UPI00281630C2|nr:(E,E)-alpha-farnesene synthase-like isoform X2 [Lycium ferocissimum]